MTDFSETYFNNHSLNKSISKFRTYFMFVISLWGLKAVQSMHYILLTRVVYARVKRNILTTMCMLLSPTLIRAVSIIYVFLSVNHCAQFLRVLDGM
jgi:hypothetical protein